MRTTSGLIWSGALAVMTPVATRLGLRANLVQFSLLVAVNAFVGAMVGMERSNLPTIAEHESLSDAYGRRVVLIAGWVVACPVPFLLSSGERAATS
jgi:hypothetical protein